MQNSISLFLGLINAGLTSRKVEICADAPVDDWKQAFEFIFKNALSAIAADGLGNVECEALTDLKVDLFLEAERIGKANLRRIEVLRHFAEFCAEHGAKVLVLKGVSLMGNYPNPLHRPESGDIDVMLLPAGARDCSELSYEKVEAELQSRGAVFTRTSIKHVAFEFEGVKIESHRNMMNVGSDAAFERTEAVIKDLVAREGLGELVVNGEVIPNVCVLPPRANALYLLRHCASHFSSMRGLIARNLVDWGLFLRGNCEAVCGVAGSDAGAAGGSDAGSVGGSQELGDAIFICGLDKVLPIFSKVSDKFVPGAAQIALSLAHIPSRFDSYSCAEQRVFDDLFTVEPCTKQCCKLTQFLRRRWKYKYLPEKLCAVVTRNVL